MAYRAFFALPEAIATSAGFPTNALFGFASMLIKLLADYRPSAVVVAWDGPEKTFRHEEFVEYKAQRKAMPELLSEQWPYFPELCRAFGFVNVTLAGYEADDILATLARQAEREGLEASVVTGDKDALQLVTDSVHVIANTRGVTDVRVYDPMGVRERFGVVPSQIPDYIGLKGDTSDNIPGVPGIGEKTAASLLAQYGSLEEVLAHAGEIGATKRRQALLEHAEQALLAKGLATLDRDAPIDIHAATLQPQQLDKAQLRELFARFEFSVLWERLQDLLPRPDAGGAAVAQAVRAEVVAPAALEKALRWDSPVAVAAQGGTVWLAEEADGGPRLLALELTLQLVPILRALLARAGAWCHDFKGSPLLHSLLVQPSHDTYLAAYLLAPGRRTYPLEELLAEAGLPRAACAGVADGAAAAELTGGAAALEVLALAPLQERLLRRQGMWALFQEIELPLTRVLLAMEEAGVRLDCYRLGEITAKLQDQMEGLEDSIHGLAGGPFNLGSPPQLAEVLFERLQLPRGRKIKTGYSTNAKTLEGLRALHPIIERIETHRELSKLMSTYLLALPACVNESTGRLHSTFHQTVTATGRLSSSDPNLQNIPVRTELGAQIRECFTAPDGGRLVVADYSQIELRLMAYLAQEPALLDSFRHGEDIHTRTAAEVFALAEDEVDATHRRYAKAVNFGILYGISAFGLAQQLGVEREEAAAYIERYIERLPRVRAFIDATIADARSQGFVTTMFGRRRPVPELHSGSFQTRSLGERLAVNSVIQGSAADIIKVAMIRCFRRLQRDYPEARLVLQIHDELILETPAEQAESVCGAVAEEMVAAYEMDPPLAVEAGIGENWLVAK